MLTAWYSQEGVLWNETVEVDQKCWDLIGTNADCYDEQDLFILSCQVERECMINMNTLADQCDSLGEFYGVPYTWGAQCDQYKDYGYPHFIVLPLEEPEEGAEEDVALISRRNLGAESTSSVSTSGAIGASAGIAAVVAVSAAYKSGQ